MKTFYLLLTLFLFYGCSDNSTEKSAVPSFNISLSPALSGNFPTLIPVNSQLIVYTTEPLDYTTVNTQSVYLKNTTDNRRVVSKVESLLTTTGHAIAIKPLVYLDPGSDYEIVVTTDVATDAGEHRSSNAVITFTTGIQIDTTSPVLIGSLPDTGSTASIEEYGVISFQFDEDLSPLRIQDVQINVKEDGALTGPGIAGAFVLSGSLLSFIPDQHLTPGSDYRVELNTSNIVDLSGNHYNGPTIEYLYFSVIPAQDATPINDFIGVEDYNLSSRVHTLTSSQNELFVGTDSGFDIFTYDNAATQTKLVHRSHLEDAQLGAVYSIALDTLNQRVYLGTSTGLSAVDISDLNLTTIISHIDTLNENGYFVPVYGVDFDQDHLYLAASSLGVMDINISNISSPTVLQTHTTKAPAFDIRVMDNLNLALSSYGNGISTLSKSTLTETDILQESVYSHNLFDRYNPNDSSDYFYSAGVKGIGILQNTGTSLNNSFRQTNAYVTRVLDRTDKSVAMMKDLGLAFFSGTGDIYQYQHLPFAPTAMTYIENQTALGNDTLVLGDRTGQLYLQVMN